MVAYLATILRMKILVAMAPKVVVELKVVRIPYLTTLGPKMKQSNVPYILKKTPSPVKSGNIGSKSAKFVVGSDSIVTLTDNPDDIVHYGLARKQKKKSKTKKTFHHLNNSSRLHGFLSTKDWNLLRNWRQKQLVVWLS